MLFRSGRAGESGGDGRGGAGLHVMGLDQSYKLAGPVYEQFTGDTGHAGGYELQHLPRPLLPHPARPMNQPAAKFASVYEAKCALINRRILHENHSFVHSIKPNV